MILSTVPGTVVLGCSETRTVSRFSSAILADLAMRGFAISFMTLVRVAFAASFRALFMTRLSILLLDLGSILSVALL